MNFWCNILVFLLYGYGNDSRYILNYNIEYGITVRCFKNNLI